MSLTVTPTHCKEMFLSTQVNSKKRYLWHNLKDNLTGTSYLFNRTTAVASLLNVTIHPATVFYPCFQCQMWVSSCTVDLKFNCKMAVFTHGSHTPAWHADGISIRVPNQAGSWATVVSQMLA